jgi:hypothetical protein
LYQVFIFNHVQPLILCVSFLTTERIFFFSVSVLILPNSGCPIFLLLGRRSLNTLDFACFSIPSNMSQNDLVQPVVAAATSQVKLCPYDDPSHQGSVTAAGIRSRRLKYANAQAGPFWTQSMSATILINLLFI